MRFAILALPVAAAIGIGTYFITQETTAAQPCAVGRAAGDIGGPFTLVNGQGETVTDKDVITGPSIVYFGYTFCPDICPTDMARNSIAAEMLAEQGLDVTPIFISIDPERDTPEIVDDFARNMHPKAIGLTGTPEQVRAASRAYRTYYRKQEGDPDYYLVDHSTHSYLVTPEDGFLDFFRHDQSVESVVETASCLLASRMVN